MNLISDNAPDMIRVQIQCACKLIDLNLMQGGALRHWVKPVIKQSVIKPSD